MGVKSTNVVVMNVKKSLMPLIQSNARASSINGVSRIREGGERGLNLSEDAMIGQIGACVGSLWLTGSPTPYMTARWYANLMPSLGDKGSDLPALNVDFKTSLMRKSQNPMDYHLLVRPHERHKGVVYVHVLVDGVLENIKAYITGWATEDMLPDQTVLSGPLKGAYRLAVSELNPVPPFRWWDKAMMKAQA